MKYVLTFIITSLLISGCATKTVPSPVINQEVLLDVCDNDTPIPKKVVIDKHGNSGYSGDEILKVLAEWDSKYNECALKHDALIKTIRDLQNQEIKVQIKTED